MALLSRALSGAALVALSLLAGCPATLHEGPKFTAAPPPKPDEALVYLYRGLAMPFYMSPAIQFNSVKVVDLPNQGYTHFYAKPGKYTYRSEWPLLAMHPIQEESLDLAAGRTYYIRVGGRYEFGRKGQATASEVSVASVLPEEGMQEIAGLMYVRPEVQRLP